VKGRSVAQIIGNLSPGATTVLLPRQVPAFVKGEAEESKRESRGRQCDE